MSAITRCDHCGKERAGRRMKYRLSIRVHVAPTAPVSEAPIVEKDICSDGCLIGMGQKRITDRAERKAREASEGAEVTALPAGSDVRAVS